MDNDRVSVKVWTNAEGNEISTYYVGDLKDGMIAQDQHPESVWHKIWGFLKCFTPYVKTKDLNDYQDSESIAPKQAVEIGVKTSF